MCVTLHDEGSLHRSLVVTLSVWGGVGEDFSPQFGYSQVLCILKLVVEKAAKRHFMRQTRS